MRNWVWSSTGKKQLSFFFPPYPSFFHVLVIRSPKSDTPKEACGCLICSDIIRDYVGLMGYVCAGREPQVCDVIRQHVKSFCAAPLPASCQETNPFCAHTHIVEADLNALRTVKRQFDLAADEIVNTLPLREIIFRLRTIFKQHAVKLLSSYSFSTAPSLGLDQYTNPINNICTVISFCLFPTCKD